MNRKLILIRSNKAILPELEAYRDVLSDMFTVEYADSLQGDFGDGIVWSFMGCYPIRPKCDCWIHDYRSLSTGRGSRFKDGLKHWINARPDVRIFLNRDVEQVMGFRDALPKFYLDMGIPSSVLRVRDESIPVEYDWVYVGAMSFERRTHDMLDAFIASRKSNERFALVGMAEKELRERYQGHPQLEFFGKVPQIDAFRFVRKSRVAVCYFPDHRPHCFQTPTKMLEYAALGIPIVANRSRSNLRTAAQLGIEVNWSDSSIFSQLPTPLNLDRSVGFDASKLLWKHRFAESGILSYLEGL